MLHLLGGLDKPTAGRVWVDDIEINNPADSSKPSKVSGETIAAISRGADWIEDDNLKQSLQSLANTIKKAD